MCKKKREEEYFGENYHYIWSDNWHIEGNQAWFMAGWLDLLFQFDFHTKETTLVDWISSQKECKFRQHPRCIKRGNVILCLPDEGTDIWFYHLSDQTWTYVSVENPDSLRLGCYQAWCVNRQVFIVSTGLKQMIELDLEKEEITGYYDFPVKGQSQISESIQIGSSIYTVVSSPVRICRFDWEDKSIKLYEVPEIQDFIRTFCFDGHRFWMTGTTKNIYIWEEETGNVTCLNDFPPDFGVWNFKGNRENLLNPVEKSENGPLFLFSLSAGKFIWLIPFQTNEILYIDRDTFQVKKFPVKGEEQTENDINNQLLQHKYLLEYVRENRYIGLFSLKNKWIFEIDSVNLTYEIMNYKFQMESRVHELIIKDIMRKKNIIYEQEAADLSDWMKGLEREGGKKNTEKKEKSIGKQTYHKVIIVRGEKEYAGS